MSLKNRILIVFMLSMLVAIWGLAKRQAYVLESNLEQSLSKQMEGLVDHVARGLDSEIMLRIDALNDIAGSVTTDMMANPDKVQRFLGSHITAYRLFPYGLQLLNPDGVIVTLYPFQEGQIGHSLADLAYFKSTMSSGKTVVGQPVRGRFSNEPLLSIAAPIRDASGVIKGVLVGSIALSDANMFGGLEKTKIGHSSYFLVLSRSTGIIVSATDKRRILQPAPAMGVNPLLDRRIYEGYEAAGVTVNSLGHEVFTVSRNMKNTDWLVLAGIKTDEAFEPIKTLKRQIYALALLVSVLISVMMRIVLARQLFALDEAATAMKKMASGSIPFAPLPVRKNDEIGLLVGSFNQLANHRQALDIELRQQRDLYQTLLKAQSEIGEGVFIIENERVTFANEALCRMYGYTLEEFQALPSFTLLTHPDDRERVLNNHRRRLHGEQFANRYEISALTRDQRRLEVEIAVAVMASDQPPRIVVVMEDITERKRMQIALHQARDELEIRVKERTAALDAANKTLNEEMAQRRRLEREIIEISEDAQTHIGQELHDGLGQILTGVAFICKGLEKKLADQTLPEAVSARKVGQLIAQAIDQTRLLARGLYPVEVEANGLMSALNSLAERTSEIFGVHCTFRCDEAAPVNERIATINFYRIAQEAVNNAVKHGRAGNILITLSVVNDKIRLTVADDGVGIEPLSTLQLKGMGLHIMRYRANMVGATLDIRSATGSGTEIVAYQYE
jgi:PAS domain S-box-containing protein